MKKVKYIKISEKDKVFYHNDLEPKRSLGLGLANDLEPKRPFGLGLVNDLEPKRPFGVGL